ncbi:MAG TPA: DNA double-strand break repair nuclease NurA, partial [Anaerolineales bacterium]|nr:DNA double-strand break repair nuclease NurA [Anaerolineales bacterium]
MPLDFQEVRKQIKEFAEGVPAREEKLRSLLDTARGLLTRYALEGAYLRDKIERAANLNTYFRSAIPTDEALNETFPLPELPGRVTVIAADGSQINPDRHLGIEYCLVNVGAIQMVLGEPAPPETIIQTQLFYGDEVFSMQEKVVALIRDMREREVLAELAEPISGPIITMTDGPIELWGKEVAMAAQEEEEEKNYFERHMKALHKLYTMKAATAGYVDKPRSDLLVRLLEIAPEDKNLEKAGKDRWLRGIIDKDLLEPWLGPGE